MHETSIIHSVADSLELEFGEEELEQLNSIYLKVGILSNVEPRLLHNAFDAFKMSHPNYQDVKIHIESIPVKIQCESCDTVTEVKQYRFLCDHCGKPSKNLIQGEELLIHKVEFND